MDAGAHEMAERDPDARAMTDKEFARAGTRAAHQDIMSRVGLDSGEVCRALQDHTRHLAQLELGHSEPDRAARAVFHVIAHDPRGVRRALGASTVGACLNFAKRSED
jgi:DNA-binding transcriptional regulator YiaG